MTRRSGECLHPRNGHTLVVTIVARISGCQNQKELRLGDQEDHGKEVVAEMYEGPVEYRVIATKGEGERMDRPELLQIEEEFRSREIDLCVMEEVGRMVRGADAVRLWGIAVDHGTRCIAPNDWLRHGRGYVGRGPALALPGPRWPQRPHLEAAQAKVDESLQEVRWCDALRTVRLYQAGRSQDAG